MTAFLKQSTAADVLIGPFVDSADGYTAETGLSPAVKLSKNGQTLAAKNDATTPVHDADGYYNCELDATDTNTVGTLVLTVVGSATSLPVRHEFYVLEEAVYDKLFGASATGVDADWTDGGRLDLLLDAILVDTGTTLQAELDGIQADTEDIQSRLPAALVSGRIDASVDGTGMETGAIDAILTRAMTESYSTDGSTMTVAQALYLLVAVLTEFAVSGTTMTAKKLDGSTTAATFTLDDADDPTSITRAS